MYIYLDPQTTVFFGQFAYDRIFWSYGIYAKISNSKLHACGGNHDTSIFSNMFSIFCQYFSILSNLATVQYVFNIYQYSSSMPLVAKYCQIWAYGQKKWSFLQIRKYSVK